MDDPITPAKIARGRKLYFDKRLCSDDTVSCATCHSPKFGFRDSKKVAEYNQQVDRADPVYPVWCLWLGSHPIRRAIPLCVKRYITLVTLLLCPYLWHLWIFNCETAEGATSKYPFLPQPGLYCLSFPMPSKGVEYRVQIPGLTSTSAGYSDKDYWEMFRHGWNLGVEKGILSALLRDSRPLLQGIEDSEYDLVLTDCPLSPLQIQQLAGIKPVHSIQPLHKAYGL